MIQGRLKGRKNVYVFLNYYSYCTGITKNMGFRVENKLTNDVK